MLTQVLFALHYKLRVLWRELFRKNSGCRIKSSLLLNTRWGMSPKLKSNNVPLFSKDFCTCNIISFSLNIIGKCFIVVLSIVLVFGEYPLTTVVIATFSWTFGS